MIPFDLAEKIKSLIEYVFMTIFVIGIFSIVLFCSREIDKQTKRGYPSSNEACRSYYGQEYMYVSGDRSPDLCVTGSGEVRYFATIPIKE